MKRVLILLAVLVMAGIASAQVTIDSLVRVDSAANDYRGVVMEVYYSGDSLVSCVRLYAHRSDSSAWILIGGDSTSNASPDTCRGPASPKDFTINAEYLFMAVAVDSVANDTSDEYKFTMDDAPNVPWEYRNGEVGHPRLWPSGRDENTWHFRGWLRKPNKANAWKSPHINITEFKTLNWFYKVGGINNNTTFDSVNVYLVTNKNGHGTFGQSRAGWDTLGSLVDSASKFADTASGALVRFVAGDNVGDTTVMMAKRYSSELWFMALRTDSLLAARDTANFDTTFIDLWVVGKK